jgi:large subunit ribosomal protein L14
MLYCVEVRVLSLVILKMIQKKSNIFIKDNTGAKKCQVISLYNKKYARSGDKALVSLKKVKITKKKKKIIIKKSDIQEILKIRSKINMKNIGGTYIKFYENSAILLNKKGDPMGTKIFGPLPAFLKKKKNFKIYMMSSYIL